MKRFFAIVLAFVMLFALSACGNNEDTSSDNSSNGTNEFDLSEIIIGDIVNKDEAFDKTATYYAYINIIDYGTITVKLDQTQAPITVENFVKLSASGFYNNLTFHRIMEGFMMQGGDPNGNGSGGSQQTIVGEFKSNGYNNTIAHKRGVISMARSNKPDSASSQFFIMHDDAPHLDGDYAAFGYVTAGMDVVDAVCTKVKPIDNNGTIPSYAQPVMHSIVISKVAAATVDSVA